MNRAPLAAIPTGEKDRVIPAWEIPAFLVLLNQYVNQFAHPYLGATMTGEKTRPSINDLFTTGQAGGLLGESLFRMASLLLERSERRRPKLRRELLAGLLCPPLAFNRSAFGDRFKTIFPSHDPADFWRLQLGASFDAKVSDNSPLTTVKRQEATLDFEFAYGLPGKR